jgi:tetratricopeptide (TPR) repeat protein
MYRDDPMILKNISTTAKLRPDTNRIFLELSKNIDQQINFAAYVLSVNLPFNHQLNQVNLSKATPLQKERYFKLVDNYSAGNRIECSTIPHDGARQRCISAQIETIQKNIDRVPNKAFSYFGLAQLYFTKGDLVKATKYFSQSLQIRPDTAASHRGLAIIYFKQGMVEKSIAEYREAIRLIPDWSEPLRNLSWILSTSADRNIRNGVEAVTLAEQACQQTHYNDPLFLDTLAVAYASVGRFSDATAAAEKALLILTRSANSKDLANRIQNRLLLYRESKMYTEH